jgi:pimeloyl-ACP methyl ester carboxylesterase
VARATALAAATDIPNTVVADCEDDAVIAAPARARLRERYPAARHLTLAQGGHYPHIIAPDALVDAMRTWLA